MNRHLDRYRHIRFISVLYTAKASATTGLVGPGFAVSLLSVYLAPVTVFLLAIAFVQSRYQGKDKPASLVCISLVTLYTGSLGLGYLAGITNHWYTGEEALMLSAILLASTVALLIYFFDNRRSRYRAIVLAFIAIVLTYAMNPGIVSFRYYSIVDNDLDADPGTIENDIITGVGDRYGKLSDGRLLVFDDIISLRGKSRKVIVRKTDADTFHVSYRGETSFPASANRRRYRLEQSAFLRIPLKEIKIPKNRVYRMGTSRLVEESKAKDIMLYHSSDRYNCQPEQAISLLESGANPNAIIATSVYPPTPLFNALRSRCPEVASILINAGADIHAKNTSHYKNGTPLHYAIAYISKHETGKELGVLIELINAGSDVSARDSLDETPLHLAVPWRYRTAELLIDAGADVSARSYSGDTPLHNALRGSPSLVELLLDAGADIDAVNNEGETPLTKARKYLDSGKDNKQALKQVIDLLETRQSQTTRNK